MSSQSGRLTTAMNMGRTAEEFSANDARVCSTFLLHTGLRKITFQLYDQNDTKNLAEEKFYLWEMGIQTSFPLL